MNVETKARLTFPGGTHPADSKELTSEIAISLGPSPKQVTLMLGQHIGAPCKPLVKKGDEVQVGQAIADTDAFVCAPVHSPVNGKVKEVTLQPHVIMGRSLGIVVDPDPENNPQKTPVNDQFTSDFDADKYSAEQICTTLREAGLVGMGGAGFPTRVKVEPNPEMPKETMIINGCECEPYITCDYRIMLEWTDQIIAGIKLAKKASGCSRVFIGIEDNKPRAIEVMTEALARHKNTKGIEVTPVRTKYPQGGERQLIRSILKKNVPTGGIPPMIGVLVLNTATVAAIAEAVVCDHPLPHRVVTVTGEAIARPGNFYVPIGMPAAELIEFCGGASDEAAKVIMGGPMMGIAVADLSTPTTKATGSILVLTNEQIGKAKSEQRQTPCIRCGRCLQACPEHLNPTKIAHAVKCDMLDVAQDYYMNACIECGCCSYVCPANIEITGHIKTGKILLARRKKLMPE